MYVFCDCGIDLREHQLGIENKKNVWNKIKGVYRITVTS